MHAKSGFMRRLFRFLLVALAKRQTNGPDPKSEEWSRQPLGTIEESATSRDAIRWFSLTMLALTLVACGGGGGSTAGGGAIQFGLDVSIFGHGSGASAFAEFSNSLDS